MNTTAREHLTAGLTAPGTEYAIRLTDGTYRQTNGRRLTYLNRGDAAALADKVGGRVVAVRPASRRLRIIYT